MDFADREKYTNQIRKQISRLINELRIDFKQEDRRDWIRVAVMCSFQSLTCDKCGIKLTINMSQRFGIKSICRCGNNYKNMTSYLKDDIKSMGDKFDDLLLWINPDIGPTSKELTSLVTQVVLEKMMIPRGQ